MVPPVSAQGRTLEADRPGASSRFDWWMTLFSGWLLIGLYLDGWAHRHLRDLDTFFTPWHGVLYSGFLAAAGFLALTLFRNRRPGDAWSRALPPGYGLSLVGVAIFIGGGVGDLIWHTVLGIEADLEALLSPTHLTLAVGGVLVGSGPFRAEWRRVRPTSTPSLVQLAPMLLSLTFFLSVLTFFTQFAHPFVHLWPAGAPPQGQFFPQALGLVGILLQTALLMGALLLAVSRWTLPFGSLLLVLTLNSALMSVLEAQYDLIAVGLLGGLAGDVLLKWLKPSVTRPARFRLFACAVPMVLYGLYFVVLAVTSGVWWSIPFWSGAIVLAGIVGWLLSVLMIPPRRPIEE